MIDPGLKLNNTFAVHPLTGEKLPVYIAPYVLSEYGSGALMGVPMHDERDCAFALENCLPLIQVISDDEKHLVNSSDKFNGMSLAEGAKAIVSEL